MLIIYGLTLNSSNIFDLFHPLENALFHHFIPALIGKPVSDLEHSSIHLGGLGTCDPWALANPEFVVLVNYNKVTQPLVNCILHQQGTFNTDIIVCQCQAKDEVVAVKCKH